MTAAMRAVRLHVPTRELRVEEVEVPEPGPGEVLVKVEAAGVCLSDAHIIDGTLTPSLLKRDSVTLGHEVAGVVADTGPGVAAWSPGDRVVLQAGELRNGVAWTRGVDYDGGWAEYALARVSTLVPLPNSIPFEQAAIIPDAVSTPWGAITTTARVRPCQAVGVWGIGGLGAHGVQLLRAIGAYPIVAIDPIHAARQRALDFGADHALHPDDPALCRKVAAVTGGRGLDVAFDFAGIAAAREQALATLAAKGKLVLVGLTNNPLHISNEMRFAYLQQRILGHYGSEKSAVPQLIGLADAGRLDFSRSITSVLPLEEAAAAVERLHTKQGNAIRLVLRTSAA